MTQTENTVLNSDRITARQAFDRFFTPPRKSGTELEQKFEAEADIFIVPGESTDLNVYSWGEGETILMVHGWGGRATQLYSFIEPLVKLGYRVLAFDAPAHGKTAGTQTNVLEFVKAIKTVVKKSGAIDSIIAHSLGSAATMIALDEGLVARKVVCLGSVCYVSTTVKTFAKLAKFSPELEQELHNLMELEFGQDIWDRLSADKRVNNLKIPALLFHDRNDREVLLEESIAINNAWQNSQLIITSRLGHRRILRNEEVIKQTVNFIASESE